MFFAGLPLDDCWRYYWVGLGTVKRLVRNRLDIWTDPTLAPYRRFLNLLVASNGDHCEYFSPKHDDWETKRIRSPYLLFDEQLSHFNLTTPLHVSTYRPNQGVPDRWRRQDATVRRLESLLFRDRKDRRLRTSELGYGHAKLRLLGTDGELSRLRSELLALLETRSASRSPVDAPLLGSSASGRVGGCS